MAKKDTVHGGPTVPGSRWRFSAHSPQGTTQLENRGIFDELMVDDWFHIEQMDSRLWWLRVGDARILVSIAADGTTTVDVERGSYGPMDGKTTIIGSGDSNEAE